MNGLADFENQVKDNWEIFQVTTIISGVPAVRDWIHFENKTEVRIVIVYAKLYGVN